MKTFLKKSLVVIAILVLVNQSYAQELPCKSTYYNKRCQERYQEDENGQKHGKFISYNEDGTVNKIAYYSHGKFNGTVTDFYGWGKIITTYLNGIENGLYQRIKSDGTIKDQGNYTNGLKIGAWIENYNDKGNYVNGEKDGLWQIYQKGWESEGGITKGNFKNGHHVGPWINLAIIGTKKPSPLVLNNQKEIAIPASTGYVALEEYYKLGYKAVFDTNGYYIEAYDATGNPIKAIDKAPQSVTKTTDNTSAIANLSIDFYEDSYLINKSGYTKIANVFPENKILFEEKPVKIIIVGHTKIASGQLTDDEILGAYILSLNRALAIKEKIGELVSSNVTIEYFGVGNIQTPGFNPDNGMVQIFINTVDPEITKVYDQLKSKYGIGTSSRILNNVGLLRVKLWNIYMNIYGTDRDKILKSIPLDFRTDEEGNEDVNPNIEKAIEELPVYKAKIQNDQISKEEYQKLVSELLKKITNENFK